MKIAPGCLLIPALAALAAAQTPSPKAPASKAPASTPDLKLVGGRFQPLTYNQLTPAQKTMADHVLAGERGSLGGPFNVLLRSPQMGDLVQQFGAEMRFHTSLPPKLKEFAIIVTARYWTAQFEWSAHRRAAQRAGLSQAIIGAVAQGRRPPGMQPDEEALYNFADELLKTKHVSDPVFNAAVKTFGEQGVVDLIGVMGYYQLVSMLLNTDRYPAQAELKPLP